MTELEDTAAVVVPTKLTTTKPHHRTPIGPEDVVTIRGKYLYRRGERFFVKGMAFPNLPPQMAGDNLELSGWIAVLEQLASDTDVNTIRLYDLDCYAVERYEAFLQRAAELGIYVMVPLTSITGDGNLMRDVAAPKCYPPQLLDYGAACLDAYWGSYPNVLVGVVGNEVMNNILTYPSAPCVKAYLDDLTNYGQHLAKKHAKHDGALVQRDVFPLLYATQHDSPTPAILPEEAIKMTLDYLSCEDDTKKKTPDDDDNAIDPFVFGINIESWCSSSETFELEDDGITESSYHALWRTFTGQPKPVQSLNPITGAWHTVELPPLSPEPAGVPVVFSEMGCSRRDFNGDNDDVPKALRHIRHWQQIPLVASPDGAMADAWSGFVAYGYDGGGNPAFAMMNTSIWNGKEVLEASPEYEHFAKALAGLADDESNATMTPEQAAAADHRLVSCSVAAERIQSHLGVSLYPLPSMPSHVHRHTGLEGLLGLHHHHKHAPPAKAKDWRNGANGGGIPPWAAVLVVLLAGMVVWAVRKERSDDPGFRKEAEPLTAANPNDEEEESTSSPSYGSV